MLSGIELIILTLFYILSVCIILSLTYHSFKQHSFSFHILFTLIYLLVFYSGYPLSLTLFFLFDMGLNSFVTLLQTLFLSTIFYLLYYLIYRIHLLPIKNSALIKIPSSVLHSTIEAKIMAFFLLSISIVAIVIFLIMNGLLLFKLTAYNQIFSMQVSAVALKRFFYFFIPALLIIYFIYQNKKAWWGFLLIGVTLGLFSYILIGGTRANLALVIALFVFIGIAQGYISIFTLLSVGVIGIVIMFILAMQRYGLALADSEILYYFLQLTRDTFSPWEHLSQILAYENIEYQNVMPIIRDFYVFIPKNIWDNRPDLILNTANYFTWEIRQYYAGLALSPTLIGSFYIMGGIPFTLMGAIFTGLIIKGLDKIYFYARNTSFKEQHVILQAYCFSNIFTIVVLTREGIDAFISRFIFFNIIFFICYFLAKLTVSIITSSTKLKCSDKLL